jgi:hypothetical protein
MNAIDAAGELAVRALRFGDPVLIEAIEVLDAVAELEKMQGADRCRCRCCGCQAWWNRMELRELRRHLAFMRRVFGDESFYGEES